MFEWDIKAPFTVSLSAGEIKANSSIEITFTFQPTVIFNIKIPKSKMNLLKQLNQEALNYKCKAICKYGNNPQSSTSWHRIIELNGIGKFPHLLLECDNTISSEITLNFGKMLLGQSNTKFVTLINMTEVFIQTSSLF